MSRDVAITVTKRFTFEAAHHLPGHPTCGRVHGHSYKVYITCGGPLDASGMVVDFKVLKAKVEDQVLRHCDHKDLNEVLGGDFQPPTVENLASWILYVLLAYTDLPVVGVKVYETEDACAELVPSDSFKEGVRAGGAE